MAEYIAELRHITKRFPGIVANDDVSLGIRQGEIYALLGENGAGKSTLMSILFGMYEPDEGDIYIRGKRERITSPAQAARLNIGMVHQHFTLVSNYTVAQNIILGAEPVRRFGPFAVVDERRANADIAALSERFGLQVNPTDTIESLPVSARQRVEILKMLYRGAEILIFDEPTSLLTPQEIASLLAIIRSLRDGGKTVIIITHKLDEIKQVADRCAVLNRGRLMAVLDVAATSTREMARQMVGREVSFSTERKPASPGAPVLEVRNLSVQDGGGTERVHGVSFTVRAGEIFAIAGVSGNGQTEVADAVAGLLPACGGSVCLNGRDVTALGIRERAEAGISYIPEDRNGVGLILDFDLAANLAMRSYYREPFSRRGVLAPAAFAANGEALQREFDIRSSQGNRTAVRGMSGGNQQKAIIAREVRFAQQNQAAGTAPLLIFVQPTRGLDIGAIEGIHARMVACRDAGAAILLVSLELDEVMDLADTVGVMYGGRMNRVARAAELGVGEIGEYMMGVRQ